MTIIPSLPSRSLLSFPPINNPITILPPPYTNLQGVLSSPFTIPTNIFHSLLDVRVPISIALTYAVTVHYVNGINRKRGYKPWSISKTTWFHALVILHNVALAVYSAWTFYGMLGGFIRSLDTTQGVTGVVDSLCKIHGQPSLGQATTYAPSSFRHHWISPEKHTGLLSPSHPPSSLTPGRMWNEGLAFYGFIFYLSKFYEVADTMIILAKGKKSSTLQTYHHAGAMLCMWAGIKYMSPPIWMFVFINSAIHALMYTYYTLTAFSIHIPKPIKRSLTTLQIIQFLVGGSYALIHLFISYTIPITIDSKTSSSSSGKTQHHLEKQSRTVRCIDTSGEAFAIVLNVLYLTPLTWLFVRFFVRSYLVTSGGGGGKKGKLGNGTVGHGVEKAVGDAARGLEREVKNL